MIFVRFCTWKHTHKTKIKLSTSITRNTERFIVVELKYFDFWQKFFHVVVQIGAHKYFYDVLN